MFVRPCVCRHVSARLPLDGFSWISILGTFIKIGRQNNDSLKYDKNIGHFTWRHKYVYIVESNVKSLNNTKVHPLLSCHDNAFVWILYTGTNASQQDKVNIFLSFHCNNVELNNRQNALFPAILRKGYFKLSATYSSIIYRERTVAFPWQRWLLERITLFFRWLGAFAKSRNAPISSSHSSVSPYTQTQLSLDGVFVKFGAGDCY